VQQIHINRHRINSIEFTIPDLTIPLKPGNECSFEIPITNHGYPTHVHLSASDSVKKNIRFLDDNPYIISQEWVSVVVSLPLDTQKARGKIKVTTGYGSHREGFNVYIGIKSISPTIKTTVDTDESLSIPGSHNRSVQTGLTDHVHVVKSYLGKKREDQFSINSQSIKLYAVVALIIVLILLIIYTFWNINMLYGAMAISVLIFLVMVYACTHFMSKKY
jgi:hypothetical protein